MLNTTYLLIAYRSNKPIPIFRKIVIPECKTDQMAYKERGEAARSSLLSLASFLSPATPLGGAPPPC
jgi:hypothetical protein